MEDSVKKTLRYILSQEKEIGVVCSISSVEFEPSLPEEIITTFKEYTYFVLANYTLESAEVDDEFLTFEAGFGEDNFASLVKIPLFSIFQIIIDENVLFINMCATVKEFESYSILSNPENQALFEKLNSTE
jgi:hypothetical protein